ncbi:LuxR C-terminal-related transcriptional regulator [Streptomyces sp. NPDC001156]
MGASPIPVAVLCDDRLTYEGAVAALAGYPCVRVLCRANVRDADVLVTFADDVSDQVLERVEQISASRQDVQVVLVMKSVTEPRLIRAIRLGVVSVVLRQQATFSDIAHAVVAAHVGHADLPPQILGTLIRHLRRLERRGPGARAGLSPREMTVLGLLSDGLDTTQIARQLSYSERTIKTIIHSIITTLGVSNRTHAVAYAIRAGLM